jgi:uncharacterized membrane protein
MSVIRRLGLVGLWLLQILLALAFTVIGVAKFGDASWARNFARWGYPDGFYMVIGALEVLGGLSLLVPRVASYGAGLLGIIMIGASATHFVHGEMDRVVPPLMYLAVVAVVGAARRRAAIRLRFAGRRAAPTGPM